MYFPIFADFLKLSRIDGAGFRENSVVTEFGDRMTCIRYGIIYLSVRILYTL